MHPTGIVADKADEPVVGDEVSRVAEPAAAGGLAAGAGLGAAGAAAVHAVEPSQDAAPTVAPETEAADTPIADMNRPDEPDADEDSSDDDDDGPEDVSGYKGHDTAGAADRFPDIDESPQDVGAAAAVEPKHEERTVPGGLEDVTAASVVAPASSAPVDPSAIGSVAGERTASTTSIAPVSRQETGAPATPAEAASEVEQTPAAAAAAGGLGVAALAAGAGALTLGERGTADVQPEVSSPTDDVPLSQLMAAQNPKAAGVEPSVSPSSSIKTRRAPPPAPVRSGTALSAASPAAAPTVLAAEPTSGTAAPVKPVEASTNPFGMDDFGAGAKPHPTHGDSGSGSGFDDFDSAFEDLGPSEAVPNAAAAAQARQVQCHRAASTTRLTTTLTLCRRSARCAAGVLRVRVRARQPLEPFLPPQREVRRIRLTISMRRSTALPLPPPPPPLLLLLLQLRPRLGRRPTLRLASALMMRSTRRPAQLRCGVDSRIDREHLCRAGVSSPTAAEGTYAPPLALLLVSTLRPRCLRARAHARRRTRPRTTPVRSRRRWAGQAAVRYGLYASGRDQCAGEVQLSHRKGAGTTARLDQLSARAHACI